MLRALQIENYALIRSLEIAFDKGFTVITGETGAGKSILMGALSLILGSRAETDILHDKTRKCIVEGAFDIEGMPLRDFFKENDLDYQPLTTLRREINEHGKSRAFINDTPVNLATLRSLASSLIDIHSQHQNLLLLDSAFRLGILDQYADNASLRADYHNALSLYRRLEGQCQQLKQACADAALRHEYLQFTLDELDKARLQPGEQEQTERSIRLLSHAEDIKAHLYAAAQQLSESEGNNVIRQLKAIRNECQSLHGLGSDLDDLLRRLDETIVELSDISYEITRKENEVEVNPSELERLNERIDLLYTLQHKYQAGSVAELLAIAERMRQELSQQSDNEERLHELEKECAQAEQSARDLANRLSKSRQEAAPAFREELEKRLSQLGMADSHINILIEPDTEMRSAGIDRIGILFSANQGVPPADLSKVASGGEMSRIMLALKSVITDTTLLPTVIFDEIDTGISGETASKVATVMHALSLRHQVIAITHLPQIAARGDQHYLVFKENRDGQAVTDLKLLDSSSRVEALAGMLGGDRVTDTARATARELLNIQ